MTANSNILTILADKIPTLTDESKKFLLTVFGGRASEALKLEAVFLC